MLIALAFAHFSSELLLKEQMITPVKKTLNNAGHINAKLIDFSEICQKNSAKSAVFYWLFLGEVSPRNFLWNWTIFLRTCPWKSFKIWPFSAKTREIGRFFCEFWLSPANIPRNQPVLLRIFDFFPAKIPRNWPIFPRICPWKSRENFSFLSAKYQRPCITVMERLSSRSRKFRKGWRDT